MTTTVRPISHLPPHPSDSPFLPAEAPPNPPAGMMAPHGFPMFNPETGQWMGMSMGMYPYPPFIAPLTAPMVRPDYYPNPMMYRGYRGGPRGRYPRSRGRGSYRGRGGYHDGDYKYENDEYDDGHDHRRKYSRSRSRSRYVSKAEKFVSTERNQFPFSSDRTRSVAVVHVAGAVRVGEADTGPVHEIAVQSRIRDQSRDRRARNLCPHCENPDRPETGRLVPVHAADRNVRNVHGKHTPLPPPHMHPKINQTISNFTGPETHRKVNLAAVRDDVAVTARKIRNRQSESFCSRKNWYAAPRRSNAPCNKSSTNR